eukprot:jgi/Psemu1/299626/fgenesh1_pm.2256_\
MTGQEMRVHVKRNSKKESGYEVEKRSDGFYYVTSLPSKKSSLKPGDRVPNKLFDTFILDVEPESESEESSSASNNSDSD